MAIQTSGFDYKTQDARSGNAGGILHALQSVDVATLSSTENLPITDTLLGFKEVGIQAVWSGSSGSGTVKIEGSNDGENYLALDSAVSVSISGGSGSAAAQTSKPMMFRYIRLVVNKQSSGTLDVYVTIKT
tara:strand:- start:858 stop:1250 length:393 start_codon:yes stop_codon:yes gene_type:complete